MAMRNSRTKHRAAPYESYSGGGHDALVLDVSRMRLEGGPRVGVPYEPESPTDTERLRLYNDLKMHKADHVVWVSAGARLFEVYWSLYNAPGGPFAFSGGTCPSVAVSGYVLGGTKPVVFVLCRLCCKR